MAVGFYFNPPSLTVPQYEEIRRALMAAEPDPKGLIFHSCFKEGDRVAIFDIWESPAAFEALSPVLMPIVQRVGADLGQPQVVEVVGYIAPKA